MPGETNLNKLIRNLKPFLHPGKYVFVCLTNPPPIPPEDIVASFREEEGTTLILEQRVADELQLPYSFIAAWITLKVHSSLEAVGLTARVATALTAAGISCNAVAGYHHDHIFVPYQEADRAVNVLRKL